jgi:hypothetical protein
LKLPCARNLVVPPPWCQSPAKLFDERHADNPSSGECSDISLVQTTQLTERVLAKYRFDVFNVTNTASFDVPIDDVTQNAEYDDFPVAGTPVLPTGCGTSNPVNNFYSCGVGLGAVNKTIGSPRQIQMTLQVSF